MNGLGVLYGHCSNWDNGCALIILPKSEGHVLFYMTVFISASKKVTAIVVVSVPNLKEIIVDIMI